MSGDQDSRAYLIAYAQEPVNAPVFSLSYARLLRWKKFIAAGTVIFPSETERILLKQKQRKLSFAPGNV